MPYPPRVFYDGKIRTEQAATNEWVLARKPNTLHLSTDKATITADGLETATVTVQLQTPMLIDDSHDNVAMSETVIIMVDDESESVVLDANGTGSFPVQSMEIGTFTIRSMESGELDIEGETYHSNVITIEAV